jgi:hypothetical protein
MEDKIMELFNAMTEAVFTLLVFIGPLFIGAFIEAINEDKRKRKEVELAKLREQQRIQQENYKRIVATNVMLSSKF